MVVAVKAIPKSKVELNRPLLLELKRVRLEWDEPDRVFKLNHVVI